MRFNEFKVLLEEKQKLYAIGDSHAKAIGSQPGWVDLATNGRSAMSADNDTAIAKVQPNSVVVLSAGANDMLSTNKTAVVGRIESLINKLKQKKCTVYYVLFAETDNPKFAKDRNQLRHMVADAVGSEVGLLDMGTLHYDANIKSKDGIHAPMGWYAQAATKAASGAKTYKPDESPESAVDDEEGNSEEAVQIISVPDGRVGTAVADIQKALIALGYALPKHGVDGVRGPETSAAVSKFQQDNNIAVDGDPGPQTVGALNKVISEKGIKFVKSKKSEVKAGSYGSMSDIDDADIKDYGNVSSDAMSGKAKESAEAYLGRSMSDKEWDYLVRATYGESAANVKSYAMVMGTILNHARTYAPNSKNGVVVALLRPNAFQAVTGTKANNHEPSAGFKAGPPAKNMRAICTAAIKYLDKVSHAQMNFSAMDPRAYGAGTNIGWRDKQLATKGSSVIAGSVFNTTLTA